MSVKDYLLSRGSNQCRYGVEYEFFLVHEASLLPYVYNDEGHITEFFLKNLLCHSTNSVCIFGSDEDSSNSFTIMKDPVTSDVCGAKLSRGCVTFEPGFQIEYSSNVYDSIGSLVRDVSLFFDFIKKKMTSRKVILLPMGFHPYAHRHDFPCFRKSRYNIMRSYMERSGTMGLDMMHRTCGIQVCIDYRSDVIDEMLFVAHCVAPVCNMLFANSPLYQGYQTNFTSYRSHVWLHTDTDRCGFIPYILRDKNIFDNYIQYVHDVMPLYFTAGDNGYDTSLQGKSLKEIYSSSHDTIDYNTWLFANSMFFPIIRIREGFLEIRVCDASDIRHVGAQMFFWSKVIGHPIVRRKMYDYYYHYSYIDIMRDFYLSTLACRDTIYSLESHYIYIMNVIKSYSSEEESKYTSHLQNIHDFPIWKEFSAKYP